MSEAPNRVEVEHSEVVTSVMRSAPTIIERQLPQRIECPLNEFSEHCTGDMPTMDISLHYMWNPDKCQFPETARREQEYWKKLSR